MKREEAVKIVGAELVAECEHAEKKYVLDMPYDDTYAEYISIANNAAYLIYAKYLMPVEVMKDHPDKKMIKWKAHDYELKKITRGRIKRSGKKVIVSFSLDNSIAEWIRMESARKGITATEIVEDIIGKWVKNGH